MKIIYARLKERGGRERGANDDEVWQIMKIAANQEEAERKRERGRKNFPPWQTKFQVIKIRNQIY